jgi:GTP cyclohydrolase I
MTENMERAEQAMKDFLEALGLDLHELRMEKTPMRVAQAYAQFFSGLQEEPAAQWGDLITTKSQGLVSVRNLHFQSICEHHLLPFFGTVHIVYCPRDGKIAGFGHFAEVLKTISCRPQLQERMTDEICAAIDEGLQSQGTIVMVKGTHMCLTMLNRLAQDSDIITVSASGCLQQGTEYFDKAWNLLIQEVGNEYTTKKI